MAMTATTPRTKSTRATSAQPSDLDSFDSPVLDVPTPITPAVVEVEPEPESAEPVVKPGSRNFDPVKHLITLQQNARYLPVNKRLLWLRSEQPDAKIETELVQVSEKSALFKAKVMLPNGACATGYGSETISDFGDYIEKAETKALGRALAALGYGTQFCLDFDFDMTGERVVDSPVGGNGKFFGGGSASNAVTEKQLKAIFAIGRETLGLSDNDIDARCDELFHCPPEQLTKSDASRFIDILKRDAA